MVCVATDTCDRGSRPYGESETGAPVCGEWSLCTPYVGIARVYTFPAKKLRHGQSDDREVDSVTIARLPREV